MKMVILLTIVSLRRSLWSVRVRYCDKTALSVTDWTSLLPDLVRGTIVSAVLRDDSTHSYNIYQTYLWGCNATHLSQFDFNAPVINDRPTYSSYRLHEIWYDRPTVHTSTLIKIIYSPGNRLVWYSTHLLSVSST